MLRLFDVSYDELTEILSDDLYRLRKQTFKDRLGWEVTCINDQEFDEYDNQNTRYILGVYNGQLVCSVRFIGVAHPNMITHTFQAFFSDVALEVNKIESSRFFVDKDRAKRLLGDRYPISYILFLSMINYVRHYGGEGIYTIVSRAMLTILKRSGWQIEPLKEAWASEKERIYLVYLPTDDKSQTQLAERINQSLQTDFSALTSWPLALPVTKAPV
ncbi:Acyl-homoserine-lactone synthase [Paramixta manurensis]|uniref:Acyl-homoserine-lactone synthase n=1 Tax=Paramixta manurensis TaxID=2740817 RepID=A0A6M8U5V5_9GAMM|nr:Acyl-homoserine-lactone synthase [Erwiniaceae bacterium PD-1]